AFQHFSFSAFPLHGFHQSLLAFTRPDFFPVVILAESWFSFWELHPRYLGLSIDVDIRPNDTRTVERADADEPNLRTMTINPPQRDMAFWAAIDVMETKTARHRTRAQFATKFLYC